MRDFSHDTDFNDKPKWKRILINLKWKYIKADRKLHGKLSLLIMLAIFFALITIAQEATTPEIVQARPICWSYCFFHV